MGRKPKDAASVENREEEILQAAITIFSEKGFSAATTSEIARLAGIAEGTIFRYFKTKKDILHGILLKMIKAFSSKIVLSSIEKILNESDRKNMRDVLKEIMLDRLSFAKSIHPMAQILFTEAIYHADIREALYENVYLKALEIFTVFRDKMVEKGEIRSDINGESILRTIMGSFASLIMQKTFLIDKEEDWLEREIDVVITIILNGISARQAPGVQ